MSVEEREAVKLLLHLIGAGPEPPLMEGNPESVAYYDMWLKKRDMAQKFVSILKKGEK
jgi:hypothetical protein